MTVATPYQLREPCQHCGAAAGTVTVKGGQNVVRCDRGHFSYNAPRTETGERPRSVASIHDDVRPKQRARILLRASGRCELCGATNNLHVGHVLPVVVGLAEGLTERELNHDENLIALCEECNLGLGPEPLPLRLMVVVLRHRTKEEQ